MGRRFIEGRPNQFCLYKSNAPRVRHQSVQTPYFIVGQNHSKILQTLFWKTDFQQIVRQPLRVS